MVAKNRQRIVQDSGMPNLLNVPTQIMSRGIVGSLDAPRAD